MTHTPANDNTPRPAAFGTLLLAHEPYIRSRMYALEKDTSKHEDIYQEVMTRALEQWAKYRTDGNFAGWLYYIIWGVINRKEREYEYVIEEQATEPNQEYMADISMALDRLGKRAEVAVMSACGHSMADIAKRYDLTPPAIFFRLKAVRELLAANDNAMAPAYSTTKKPRLRA